MTGIDGFLELQDGTRFAGQLIGKEKSSGGEVVFNTGMVGYPESMTDPSYRGQILAFTYPLIGNYGVPGMRDSFESDRIHVRGIVAGRIMKDRSHHEADRSLAEWMEDEGVVGITDVDTRELTKHLRSSGTMLGRIIDARDSESDFKVTYPNTRNLVAEVSTGSPIEMGADNEGPCVLMIDCGCKRGIVEELLERKCRVIVSPWDRIPSDPGYDGVMISNGPGDPSILNKTIENISRLMEEDVPVAGICLGCQLIALALGASTYKLRFGHRSQNQPCMDQYSRKCVITSQNHGYAIDERSLPEGCNIWYRNLNDSTVEGIVNETGRFFALQFHPEARPGPTDSLRFFDRFMEAMSGG